MEASTPIARSTKYCLAVEEIVRSIGHGTNQEIHTILKQAYPEVSATTVHRVTARLAERGLIAIGPKASDGSVRYDAYTEPHDHFVCQQCDGVKDVTLTDSVHEQLESALGGCRISGQLIVQGMCVRCCAMKSK
jgi:Fur family peroxide stress response transcriptional regulator